MINQNRVSQTWFFQTERLASEPFERKVLAVGAAHRQHLPLPVNACGARSQSVQRRLRNPEARRKGIHDKKCRLYQLSLYQAVLNLYVSPSLASLVTIVLCITCCLIVASEGVLFLQAR